MSDMSIVSICGSGSGVGKKRQNRKLSNLTIDSTRSIRTTSAASHGIAGGFSLFELVVFILCVAIIYAYAANRFAEFPGQAERANFLAITTQLQSAINMEMMFVLGGQHTGSAQKMEGANPMELMLEPPNNYLGAFDVVDTERLPRRVWYFDRLKQELVYLVNDVSGVYLDLIDTAVPTDEIRFKIVLDYGEEDIVTGLPVAIAESDGSVVAEENRRTRLNGILMRPVIPFKWEGPLAQSLVAKVTTEF